MKKQFPHLHLHTTHSHLDAFGTVDSFYKKAAQLGSAGIAHTEHGNISSWPEAQLMSRKYGVKAMFGIEAYVVPDASKRERGYNHVTLIAANQAGVQALFRLVSDSYNHGFYYKPRMSWKDIVRIGGGNLFLFSGCWSGFASQFIIGKQVKNPTHEVKKVPTWDQVKQWLLVMKKRFPGRFFMELMPIWSELQKEVLSHEINMALDLGIPFIATNDCHYPDPMDHDIQDDLVCIRSGKRKNDPDRSRYDVTDLYFKTDEEMLSGFYELGVDESIAKEAVAAAYRVASEATGEIPSAKPVRFRQRPEAAGVGAPTVDPEDTEAVFRSTIEEMWRIRNFIPRTEEYLARAEYEIGIFVQKDYADYMLVIWDLVWACKTRPTDKGGPIFVGPARGSSSGSLVCYILAITEIDPFYDDLYFERFVDPHRTDPPDIDIDFPDDEREWVAQYLRDRWGGSDHVASLISHSVFKGKIALTDIGRIYNIPIGPLEKVKSLLIDRSSGDARASFTLEDTFKEFPEAAEIAEAHPDILKCRRLEGQIRHTGIHAAGIIVSTECKLQDVGAFYAERSFWMDKKIAEKYGHLKIDALGLNTLTILREAARNLGYTDQTLMDFYYRMDMRDPTTIEGFTEADVEGIFQFDGRAQMVITKQLQPATYEEVRDLTAMSRPGPLHCGGTTRYIERARGKPFVIEPSQLEAVTADSYGVMLYQEQVMKIMRDIGRMTWPEIVDVRRHISKSVGKEHFEVFHESFNRGAIDHHRIDPKIANEIWDQMCTFGSWAFNKAHAAAYTRISIWTMHMKRKHPAAYLAAMAGFCNSEDRRARAIRLFQKRCGKVLNVDINRSRPRFFLDDGGLRIGFSDIKGIGAKAAEIMTANQPYVSMADFLKRVPLRVVNKRVRKVLHVFGAFLPFSDSAVVQADRKACDVDEYLKGKAKRQWASDHCYWLFPIDFNKARKQLKCVPIETIQSNTKEYQGISVIGRIRQINQRDYKELGSEDALKKLRYGEETRFINITIEDEDSFIMVTVPRRNYRRLKKTVFNDLKEGSIMLAKGNVPSDLRRLFVENLWAVTDD